MTSPQQPPESSAGSTAQARDDVVAQIIRSAGRREAPPPGSYESTLLLATDAWRRKTRRRQFARWCSAAAASVLVVALTVWQARPPIAVPPDVAFIDRVIGPVEVRSGDANWATVGASARSLQSGMSIRTGSASRVGLLFAKRYSIRIGAESELRLMDADRLQLIYGQVFVATLTDAPSSLVVTTAKGDVLDVGTQFELQQRDGRLRVRVREGEIILQRTAGDVRSSAGEELVVDKNGDVSRGSVRTDHPDWRWVETLSPSIETDGLSLAALLRWVARETGRAVQYADAETQRRAQATILHGSVGALPPLDALGVMMSTTDLSYRLVQDGSILIGAK